MTLAIADVSEFQKTIDWAAYGAANPAVIVRVHNSNRPDNYAQPNIAGARRYCRWRGFYQYLTAGADPVKAAHDMQQTLGPTLPGEVACLDLEEGTGDQSARRAAWINALQDPVEWTYSGLSFARAHLPGVKVEWLAAYGQGEPTDAHLLWQNTNAARFAGITGPCDGSLFNGTIDQLIALTNGGSDMDATQDARLTHIETLLTWALDDGSKTPFSGRGELVARVRAIDSHTVAPPITADAVAAKVAAINIDAIAAAVVAKLSGATGPTKEAIAAAVRAELATNPLSLR